MDVGKTEAMRMTKSGKSITRFAPKLEITARYAALTDHNFKDAVRNCTRHVALPQEAHGRGFANGVV
jgi:hypothetical protein